MAEEQTERAKVQTSLMKKGRKTIWHLQQMKDNGEKIVQLCPADWPPFFSRFAEMAGVDVIRYTTSGMTVEERGNNLIPFTRQLRAAAQDIHLNAYVQTQNAVNPYKALEYCSMLLADGADSCLIMGVQNEMVEYLSKNNVSLFGHVGALSGWQTAQYGGYKRMGKTADDAYKVWRQAYEYQESGMKCMTIELVPEEVAQKISESLHVPVIGIAAGAPCDGSELVIYDMLDMMPNPGVHAKIYGSMPKFLMGAFVPFVQDVKGGQYPQPEHGFLMDADELEKFTAMVDKDLASV